MKKQLIAMLALSCILLTGCRSEKNNEETQENTYTVISVEEFLKLENENIELFSTEAQVEVTEMLFEEQTVKVLTLENH